jgi:hypothetical protein
MPYASDKQRKWMHHNRPEIAERWDMEERASRSARGRRKETILTGPTTYGQLK